jgi:hypothetical protein
MRDAQHGGEGEESVLTLGMNYISRNIGVKHS